MKREERKDERKKKGLIVLLLLLLVVLVYGGGKTIARYIGSASSSSTVGVAKFAVKVGDKTLGAQPQTVTADFVLNSNANIAKGKIAPGGSGTFTYVIDPAGSEVSLDWESQLGEITNLPAGVNLQITGVTANGTAITKGSDGKYKGTINLNGATALSATNKVTLVVTATWENDDSKNDKDTQAGIAAANLTLNNTITVQQHI